MEKEIDSERREEILNDNLSEKAAELYNVFGDEWLSSVVVAARKESFKRYAAAIEEGEENVSEGLSQTTTRGIFWFDNLDEVRDAVTINENTRTDLIHKIYDTEENGVIVKLPGT